MMLKHRSNVQGNEENSNRKPVFNKSVSIKYLSERVNIATVKRLLLKSGPNLARVAVLAVDDRHVAFCEYNGSVARIICVAVATLANEKLLERVPDNDLLLCRTSNKTRCSQ
jgi:hypothetical protein